MILIPVQPYHGYPASLRAASLRAQDFPLNLCQNSHKPVILSGAPHRFIAGNGPCGAESKDPGDAYRTDAVRAFSTTEVRVHLFSNLFAASRRSVSVMAQIKFVASCLALQRHSRRFFDGSNFQAAMNTDVTEH
jgi:hypothetical protein